MKDQIQQYIQTFPIHYLGTDLISANILREIIVDGNTVKISLQFGFALNAIKEKTSNDLAVYLQAHFPSYSFMVDICSKIEPKVLFSNIQPHPKIKNIIAVASGKGGVGKSTTSVNIACALAADGAKVGLLDADIHGPSQPTMLGVQQKPTVYEDKRFDPIHCHGVESMSIGYLVDTNTPMVWRGPMVSGALQQLFFDTNWSDLDYLIIDLPPGTGDIQLTLAKKIPVTAAVVVTTPQDVALLDASKAVEMFKKVSVPVFGLIENMAVHTCEHCGHQQHIFGDGGVESLAKQIEVPVLGSLPLDIHIREQADIGVPIVVKQPSSDSGRAYFELSRTIAARLSLQASQIDGSLSIG